jgi:hypothetical protein
MSFGLCNALATYARAMQLVLQGLTWDIVLAFLDDILVMGKDFESHMRCFLCAELTLYWF